MPKLYLLRHAQAESAFSKQDKDRRLTPHGISQVKNLAPYLKDINLTLCSSATRTIMTYEAIKESGCSVGIIDFQTRLYNANATDILHSLQDCAAANILVIAHNPGIHDLARSLALSGDPSSLEKINISYSPASLSIFDCPIERWCDLKISENILLNFISCN